LATNTATNSPWCIVETNSPRPLRAPISPSCSRMASASRTGVRLIASSPAICSSTSGWSGPNRPARIASLIAL
jgi:hypothetical protein